MEMDKRVEGKRSVEGVGRRILDEEHMDCSVKFAAAKASPSVVGILSHDLPADMAVFRRRGRIVKANLAVSSGREIVYWGTGIVIECDKQDSPEASSYVSTIITAAYLFVRTDGLQPNQIKVDVHLWDGNIFVAQVLACDFHYNLAAIRIQSHFPLQTATLRGLDDAVSISPIQLHHPNPSLFKVSPGTKLITLARSFEHRNAHLVGSAVFWATLSNTKPEYKEIVLVSNSKLDCKELYWLTDSNHPGKNGGAVLNYVGEVIGLMFYDSPFLPVNIVSSWWKHFKSCGRYRRPWLGVEIANLHSCSYDYLKGFLRISPNLTSGVAVTKVAEDSPAYCSGICPKDVIVKCDGKLVRSTLEFFEAVWNKLEGESLELDVLKLRDGETQKLSLTVKEASPDQFYHWERSVWSTVKPIEATD